MPRSPFVLLSLLLFCRLGLAQSQQCVFCHHDGSQFALRQLQYADGSRWVCEKCREKLSHCAICQLPTDQKPYRDGRVICQSCQKTGLTGQSQAEKLYREVVGYVDGLLGEKVSPLPPVRICDKDELQTRFVESGRSMQVAGFYQPYNPEQIYVLSYETLTRAGSTLAHEYTHAWQSRHSVAQDRALKEGFATWVEYHYLESKGRLAEAKNLVRTSDPDYGASLGRLLELERKSGRAAVLKLGRTGTKI